jgi:hypothetical protein
LTVGAERLTYGAAGRAVGGAPRALLAAELPPFRGGVLYYGRQIGMAAIREKLKSFEEVFGERYRVFDD